MYRSSFLLLLATVVLLQSCGGNAPANKQKTNTAALHDTAPEVVRKDTATHLLNKESGLDMCAFLSSLIDTAHIKEDTSWRNDARDDMDEGNLYLSLPTAGDNPDNYIAFPFKDVRIKYVRVDSTANNPDNYRFYVNGCSMPKDTVGEDPEFHYLKRFSYRGKPYLLVVGGLRSYNGYGDRVQYNYFFDLSKPYKLDCFENSWLYVVQSALYGDLSNDGQLDRLTFDGAAYPAGFGHDGTKDTITIVAQTYSNRKWIPLKDAAGKPYYIHVVGNDYGDSLAVADHHWMRPLPKLPLIAQ